MHTHFVSFKMVTIKSVSTEIDDCAVDEGDISLLDNEF